MSTNNELSGIAALSICESLLLAMNDRMLLTEGEIVAVLQDAATSHEVAAGCNGNSEMHLGVANLIKAIIAGGNSVRRAVG